MADVLDQQVRELQQENKELRARLTAIEKHDKRVMDAQKRLLRGGWRILLPMIDRKKVVRSFSKLTQTLAEFANERSEWPPKEQILVDTREFLESIVRFTIRRRTLVLIFSLIAITVPAFQVWLVVQQNEIIEAQNGLSRIQLYDMVSRAMTEGDRNARQMSGALLARAEIEFLDGVIEEAFLPGQQDNYSQSGVNAAKRRLEDAAFRGYLVRAAVRVAQKRKGTISDRELYRKIRPMFQDILQDSTDRMPRVLKFGQMEEAVKVENEDIAEQVDHYIIQVGELMKVYNRLSRTVGEEDEFYQDFRPLITLLAGRTVDAKARFTPVYVSVMQDFLWDLALEPEFGESVSLTKANLTPEKGLDQGIKRLRDKLGAKALNWTRFKQQVAIQ